MLIAALLAAEPHQLSRQRDSQQAQDTLELLRQCSPTADERQLLQPELEQRRSQCAATANGSGAGGGATAAAGKLAAVDMFFCKLVEAGFWGGALGGPACNGLEGRLRCGGPRGQEGPLCCALELVMLQPSARQLGALDNSD